MCGEVEKTLQLPIGLQWLPCHELFNCRKGHHCFDGGPVISKPGCGMPGMSRMALAALMLSCGLDWYGQLRITQVARMYETGLV